jgi:hypothetical protein
MFLQNAWLVCNAYKHGTTVADADILSAPQGGVGPMALMLGMNGNMY